MNDDYFDEDMGSSRLESIKQHIWHRFGVLVVHLSDERLSDDERAFVQLIGMRFFNKGPLS